MTQETRKTLEHIARKAEHIERAMNRDEVRDKRIEERQEQLLELSRAIVVLLQDVLRELRHHRPPQTFRATSGVSIRPAPGGQ